jgi:peptidoglycan/xylan/chitin deacetylase (PgdA/CDA1 family)
MVTYWVKTPRWLKRLFPKEMIWDIANDSEPSVYLTFDDGPHPTATPFVLELLAQYSADATFFCVGNNVARYPEVYAQIQQSGHTSGNHTYNHINGWKTTNSHYLKNIEQAGKHIKSKLFRPPYGRIRLSLVRKMMRRDPAWKIYMWDILSADFDQNITAEQCLENVLSNIEPGSIIVFHDSEKAWERMHYTLPRVLEYCMQKGWKMKALPGQ